MTTDPSTARRATLALAVAACTALAWGGAARADDRADMDRTKIIGNRELPKVLYIVPWKKPLPGEMSGRPFASVLDEALAPLDRDVFRRQVQYYAQGAQPAAAEAGSTATGPADAPEVKKK